MFFLQIVFLTSRVHPGETPASFVFKGFLDFILRENDDRSISLRNSFVFKMVPMLNPDGVKRGHYRTDIFGVNLNRTYQNPDAFRQPSIFAIKTLMMYHHFNRIDPKLCTKELKESASQQAIPTAPKLGDYLAKKSSTDSNLTGQTAFELHKNLKEDVFSSCETINEGSDENIVSKEKYEMCISCEEQEKQDKPLDRDANLDYHDMNSIMTQTEELSLNKDDSDNGVFIYIDLHGHASKRGCFIYGNHFTRESDMIECMLLPKLISVNSLHFDFQACNFTEKNMYHKDKKDGLSKEGSGRVSMFKALGITHRFVSTV